MNCPYCSKEITDIYVASNLAWCDNCRIAFLFDSLAKGEPEPILRLAEDTDCPKGFSFSRDEKSETLTTRSFSFLGIPLALIFLFWLYLTVFSFTIHFGLALLMLAMCVGIGLIAYTFLACRLSLTFYPQTGKIVYAKGPFRWLSSRRKFNAQDVEEIREGALLAAEGEIPRPAVFLKDGKSFLLDFSKNAEKREFLELALDIFIARSK